MDLRNFSDYFFEHLASGNDDGVLPISSACNAKCVFCSNDNNPFETLRVRHRPVPEIEKVLWSMSPKYSGRFLLNEAITGKLSEGEVFTHPQWADILQAIRNKYRNNKIVISSNGSLITDDVARELAKYKPVDVSISIHSFKEHFWKSIFNIRKQKYFENAINSFDVLRNHRIPCGVRMIALPSLVGYDDLENSIVRIKEMGFGFIGLTHASWTRDTPPDVIRECKVDPVELAGFVDRMIEKHKIEISYHEHPNRPMNFNTDLIGQVMKKYRRHNRIFWLVSASAYPKIKPVIESMGYNKILKNHVIKVTNDTYGGTIDCAGLWTVKDVDNAVKRHKISGEQLIVNGRFLNKYGYDLMGDNIVDYLKTTENKLEIIKH